MEYISVNFSNSIATNVEQGNYESANDKCYPSYDPPPYTSLPESLYQRTQNTDKGSPCNNQHIVATEFEPPPAYNSDEHNQLVRNDNQNTVEEDRHTRNSPYISLPHYTQAPPRISAETEHLHQYHPQYYQHSSQRYSNHYTSSHQVHSHSQYILKKNSQEVYIYHVAQYSDTQLRSEQDMSLVGPPALHYNHPSMHTFETQQPCIPTDSALQSQNHHLSDFKEDVVFESLIGKKVDTTGNMIMTEFSDYGPGAISYAKPS